MQAQGFGGAVLFDADGSDQDGNARVPHGATFFSPGWRELYRHTLREAARLGLEISLNIQSGWNLGGPMIHPEDAPKKLVWSFTAAPAGDAVITLPEPAHPPAFYRDVAVVAFPTPTGRSGGVKNLEFKALEKPLGMSAPDTHLLFDEDPAGPADENLRPADVLDLTDHLHPDGTFDWSPPAPGAWTILRFGCTLNDHCRVSTSSEGWDGYALDPYDAAPFRAYWDAVVEPLIADAGPLAGKTLRYLHTDSWEVEAANWTPTLREEFRTRRGYELRTYLPVVAGQIVGSREVSDRFLEDLRRTLGDLAMDNHYRPFRDLAHRHGLEIHPESGGPHASPFDSLQCLGMDDAPMSEFWARSPRHRTTDAERFFVKQPASAAHTYGKKLVLAEGFTDIGPHWQESVADNLKPSFDQAICEGLNRLFWHAFVCSPASTGTPGQQYFAGTHFNPKTTWFAHSGAFLKYVNRCQFMMQQGRPVADVLYYYGDHVPNFAQLRASDPAGAGAGYDYDVATAEVLLTRASVRDGRIVLPDGPSYAALALPDYPAISLPVLRKVREMVLAGATVVGPKPQRASGLTSYPTSDAEVRRIADELWDFPEGANLIDPHEVGKGKVFTGDPDRRFNALRFGAPDCLLENIPADPGTAGRAQFVHRRDGATDIYFVANRTPATLELPVAFRAWEPFQRQPEWWDPVTGKIRDLRSFEYPMDETYTQLKLLLPPYGAGFVVFRKPVGDDRPMNQPLVADFPQPQPVQTLTGPWTVHFDPRWGGPAAVDFPELADWTQRSELGIRWYSGTATYEKTFDLSSGEKTPGQRLFLDLGEMHEVADVRLNGVSLGNLWARPFRAEVTDAVRATGNHLEVDVTNFWANRVIGDASLPEAERLTRTNIRRLTARTSLLPSGLLGPVRILSLGR